MFIFLVLSLVLDMVASGSGEITLDHSATCSKSKDPCLIETGVVAALDTLIIVTLLSQITRISLVFSSNLKYFMMFESPHTSD